MNITETSLSSEEIRRVKGLGCLRDKRYADVFNVRVITRNGKITADEHRAIADASEKFGSGEVCMTSRLQMEIQGVKYENIDALIEYLAKYGLMTGGTGALVRPIVSCKGTTCVFGLIDTFGLSLKIHERFYVGYHKTPLPHKFKIAVGGCPNNCVKPDINDLGVIGQLKPVADLNACRGCKVCQVENSCPMKAVRVENGKIEISNEECNNCGRCREKCPFGAISYVNGFRVYIGGRWGKKCARGIPLEKIFETEDEVLSVIEKAILFYKENGVAGERFNDTVNRLGFEKVNAALLGE